jgi:hypothetical protein
MERPVTKDLDMRHDIGKVEGRGGDLLLEAHDQR